MTSAERDTILKLELLCDSGTWEYGDLELEHLTPQEVPADNLIRHWRIPRETGEYLYRTVLEQKPKKILELGTSVGYSTLWLGAAATNVGGRIDTIDYYGPKFTIARQFIQTTGLEDVVTQHHCRIEEFLSVSSRSDNSAYEFVFMDADKHNYLHYWKLLQPLLSPDFIVIADNAGNFAHSMRDFVEYCKNDPNLHCEHIDIGTGLFIVRPNSN